jgi:hypothetical protein
VGHGTARQTPIEASRHCLVPEYSMAEYVLPPWTVFQLVGVGYDYFVSKNDCVYQNAKGGDV